MEVKHTPGPWYVNLQGNTIRGEDGFVCGLNDVSPADIRLLVAAPELLAALNAMVAVFAVGFEAGDSPAVDSARAAIAKATQ